MGHLYDKTATGHYASILEKDGKIWLGTAQDPVKDQTDFLAQIDYLQVSKLMFPLGGLMKNEVRDIARVAKLPSAQRKDSQGICFLGKINYNDFLRRFLGEKEGAIIEMETGKRIGTHKGYWFHTIGQRKGLEIALGKPMFVTRINPIKNTIRLGERSELLTRNMVITDVIETIPGILNTSEPVDVQIRYRSAAIPATLRKGETPNEWIVCFQSDASAVTPGQSAVIYQNDCIIGGGIIADQRLLKKYAL